jgi:hypothetical protein
MVYSSAYRPRQTHLSQDAGAWLPLLEEMEPCTAEKQELSLTQRAQYTDLMAYSMRLIRKLQLLSRAACAGWADKYLCSHVFVKLSTLDT